MSMNKILMLDLIEILDDMAPEANSEEWDNGGFLVGRANKHIMKIMIALEPALSVIDEAIAFGADLLLVHHPVIFAPLSSVTSESLRGEKVLKLAENSIALYAAHTSFDVACGGNNDCLLELLGVSQSRDIAGGTGRMAELAESQSLKNFAKFVAERLDIPEHQMRISSSDIEGMIQKVAVCTGAGGDIVDEAISEGCDCLITGDMRYHAALDAVERDFNIIDAGHFGTEKIFSKNMMEKLMSALTHKGYNVGNGEGICIKVAESEHSPFSPIL